MPHVIKNAIFFVDSYVSELEKREPAQGNILNEDRTGWFEDFKRYCFEVRGQISKVRIARGYNSCPVSARLSRQTSAWQRSRFRLFKKYYFLNQQSIINDQQMPARLSLQAYTEGILRGDRMVLSRAITLIESTLATDRVLATEVLEAILPHAGHSFRIGITGVPGVGKSTFIETFGNHVTSLGKKLAVLTVDPSSERSGGSILGDKTRMETLVNQPLAYVRPSPSGTSLGGVTRSTRQAMLLCEAAGYEVIFVETVGVGQSETVVHGMTDFFLLLMLAGAGDELQGIKRGIMEMADAVAINKADGENMTRAKQARAAYENALHLMPLTESGWQPPVQLCSALTGTGIDEIWTVLEKYRQATQQSGYFTRKRQEQNRHWLHETIQQTLTETFYQNISVKSRLTEVEESVKDGKLSAWQAAEELLKMYKSG